ncbi:MAG: YdcF family protein [Chitinophagales bacterium]
MKSKKWKIVLFAVFILFVILLLSRNFILSAAGNFLVYQDEINHVEYAFVLSGQAYDRGDEAINLYMDEKIEKIICTGENMPSDIKSLGLNYLESDLTAMRILEQMEDSSIVSILPKGTSTREEAEAIMSYCMANKITECVIVSSLFHTRRVKNVFQKDFAKAGISVYIHGAPSSSYEEEKWWKSEYGLIAVNNEYLKLLYYLMK